MWFWINRNTCSLVSNPFRKMVKEASSLETLTVADTCFLNGSKQAEIAVWSLSVTESVSLNLSLSPTNSQETVPLYDFLNVLTQFFFFFANNLIFTQTYTLLLFFKNRGNFVHWNGSMKIDTENSNSFWREIKVKHRSLKESETREIITIIVMLIQFAKVYKALLHIWSIIIYNQLGGK